MTVRGAFGAMFFDQVDGLQVKRLTITRTHSLAVHVGGRYNSGFPLGILL
jgi:hypothetical protein